MRHSLNCGSTDSKYALRKHFLAVRQSVNADGQAYASEAVARHLLEHFREHHTIAGYMPVRGELNVGPALALLENNGHRICLPVVTGRQEKLLFKEWQHGHVLEKDIYGIDAPQVHREDLMPDILLVPMLAFDGEGHRLGYGAGHYDRTIQYLRESVWPSTQTLRCIGVAYACQQASPLPVEAHDQQLDAVVTENGIMRLA